MKIVLKNLKKLYLNAIFVNVANAKLSNVIAIWENVNA